MKLKMALDEKLHDQRLRDRFVAEGKVTKQDLEKFLNTLPDDSANATDSENKQESNNVQ
jgi:hypothetical protein